MDDITVSKYYLLRMVEPPTNKMKSCGNILDLKVVFAVTRAEKNVHISREKEMQYTGLTQSPWKYKHNKEFLFIKILLRKLSDILQLKSKVKSLS